MSLKKNLAHTLIVSLILTISIATPTQATQTTTSPKTTILQNATSTNGDCIGTKAPTELPPSTGSRANYTETCLYTEQYLRVMVAPGTNLTDATLLDIWLGIDTIAPYTLTVESERKMIEVTTTVMDITTVERQAAKAGSPAYCTDTFTNGKWREVCYPAIPSTPAVKEQTAWVTTTIGRTYTADNYSGIPKNLTTFFRNGTEEATHNQNWFTYADTAKLAPGQSETIGVSVAQGTGTSPNFATTFPAMTDQVTIVVPQMETTGTYRTSDPSAFKVKITGLNNTPVTTGNMRFVYGSSQPEQAYGTVSDGFGNMPLNTLTRYWDRVNTCPLGNRWDSVWKDWGDIAISIGSLLFGTSTEHPDPYPYRSGSFLPACKKSENQNEARFPWDGVYENPVGKYLTYLPDTTPVRGVAYLATRGSYKATVELPLAPTNLIEAGQKGTLEDTKNNQFYYESGLPAYKGMAGLNYGEEALSCIPLGKGGRHFDCNQITQDSFEDVVSSTNDYFGPEGTTYTVHAGNTGVEAWDTYSKSSKTPMSGYYYNIICDPDATGVSYSRFHYGNFINPTLIDEETGNYKLEDSWEAFSLKNINFILQHPNKIFNMWKAMHLPYADTPVYDNVYPMTHAGANPNQYRGYLGWTNEAAMTPYKVIIDGKIFYFSDVELRRNNSNGEAAYCNYPGDTNDWLSSKLSFKLKERERPKLGGTTTDFPKSAKNYLEVSQVTLSDPSNSNSHPYGWVDFSVCLQDDWNYLTKVCSKTMEVLDSVRFYKKRSATITFPSKLWSGRVSRSNTLEEGDYVAVATYNKSSNPTKNNRVYKAAVAWQDFSVLPPVFSCDFPANTMQETNGKTHASFADMITINGVAPETPGGTTKKPVIEMLKNNANVIMRLPGTKFNYITSNNIFAKPRPGKQPQNIGTLYISILEGTPAYKNNNIIIKDHTGKRLTYGTWFLPKVANGMDGQFITGWKADYLDMNNTNSYSFTLGFKEASKIGKPIRFRAQYAVGGYAITRYAEKLGPDYGVWLCEKDIDISNDPTNPLGLPESLPVDVKRIVLLR